MIEVIEFIAELEQGYTEAFLCRGSDNLLYAAKSRRSGKESLVREWVCGRIGRELGLPVPPIAMLSVSQSVAAYAANEHIEALAAAPGFGSQYVGAEADDALVAIPILNVADVSKIGETQRRRVLLFDWWIQNFDRTDDNPNLLWDPATASLHVIDHNLAFDQSDPKEFWSRHIFRDLRPTLADPQAQEADLPKMQTIISMLPAIWSELPDVWTEACTLTFDRVDATLRRCFADDFWDAQ